MVQSPKKKGPGYEGVDPNAQCSINRTSKFAVWDAPGIAQPPPQPPKKLYNDAPLNINLKQKQNNNGKFLKANTLAAMGVSGGGFGKGFPATTKLTCSCGEVVVSLPGPALNRVESCDVDWRKAVEWVVSNLKGPTVDPPYLDLAYFPNVLQVEQGGEMLDVFLLKEGYNTKRVVASCCGTVLLGDHPLFQGQKIVACLSQTSKVDNKNCEMMPAQKRIYQHDIPKDLKDTVDPFVAPDQPAQPVTHDLIKWKAKHPRYTTIQRLMGAVGPLQYMDPSYEGPEPYYNRLVRTSLIAGNL